MKPAPLYQCSLFEAPILDIKEGARLRDMGIKKAEDSAEVETWKDIPGFGGLYQVSNLARVRILDRPTCPGSQKRKDRKKIIPGKFLIQRLRAGYPSVTLMRKGKVVHRLIAEAFIPNPENKPQVNHINGIKTDNRIENLEWCTAKENRIHALETGLCPTGEGLKCSKLSAKDVDEIRSLRKQGVSGRNIAKLFGVASSTVFAILTGKNWKRYNPDEAVINPVAKRAFRYGSDHPTSKKVIQLDTSDQYIKEFVSLREASKILGISNSYLCNCLKGKGKTAGGFKWKYANEYNKPHV